MPQTPDGVSRSHARQVVVSLAWMTFGGLSLAIMNALMRLMTQQLDSFQAQFMRYAFGLVIVIPILLRASISRLKPHSYKLQLARGGLQVMALTLFFLALPYTPLADMTAIMFISPVFTLLGASIFLKEEVTLVRWAAALVGFVGVLVVVWPHLTTGEGAGLWSLVMLASTPFFAGSFLMTKAMTRHNSNETLVVWLNVSVALLSMPMALFVWQNPLPEQWATLAVCGLLGTLAHYGFTRAFSMSDISLLQSVRFLDLIWSSVLGMIIFGNLPAVTALAGGVIIIAANIWMTRHEARKKPASTA